MGSYKITGLLIGILISSFAIGIIGLFMANGSDNYGTSYDNNTLEAYNKLQEIQNLSKEVYEETDIESDSSLFDIVGAYFTAGYQAFKLTGKSVDTLLTISDSAVDDAGLGGVGNLLSTLIFSLIFIIVAIGIFLAAIIKRDL